MASYPTSIKTFSTFVDYTGTIWAVNDNELHDEIVAIESTLGLSPHQSGQGGGNFTSVAARLDGFDLNKASSTHTHPYPVLDTTSSDIRTLAMGDNPSAGAVGKAADAGHGHGMPVFAGTGSSNNPARSDHGHTVSWASYYLYANQTIAYGNPPVPIAISWTASGRQYDTDGYWASGNPTRLVVPAGKAGVYDLSAVAAFPGFPNDVTVQQALLYVNGSIVYGGGLRQCSASSGGNNVAVARKLRLSAADYVELFVLLGSPTYPISTSYVIQGTNTWMQMTYIGP